jgi:uncharacterized membrane protein (DUF485 family)
MKIFALTYNIVIVIMMLIGLPTIWDELDGGALIGIGLILFAFTINIAYILKARIE